ncbi:MAG: hypothetical protein AAF843_17430, partial [Bacteroidota bacterium]
KDVEKLEEDVLSVSIKNTGNTLVYYGWNDHSKAYSLAPGEEDSWGFDGHNLGGNSIYYDFDNGSNPSLTIKKQLSKNDC